MQLSDEKFDRNTKGRALTAEIGDSLSTDFSPQLKLTAWGEECLFKVSLLKKPMEGPVSYSHLSLDGKEGLSIAPDSAVTHRLFQRSDGNLEWEIVVQNPPGSNLFSFSIRQKGMEFLYQGPLSDSEISAGAERPDSVIGSYAVYSGGDIGDIIDIRGNDTLKSLYGCGKVFHIYRPLVHDSRGWSVWCDLKIDTMLCIIIPQKFIDSATYPITIGPTFGNTNIGASTAYLSTTNAHALSGSPYRHIASAGEDIVSYSIYCLTYSNPSYVSFAAYTCIGGYPVSRLAPGLQLAVTNGSMQWNTTSSVSQAMAAGNTYVTAYGDVTPTLSVRARYDSEANAVSLNSAAGLSSTWSHSSYGGMRWSMYATYTTSPASVKMRRRKIIDQIISFNSPDSIKLIDNY